MPAIGAAIGAIGAAISASGFLTTFVGRLLISVAASALLQALAPKPREPGIKTEVTQTGGTNPCSFILMQYATAGTRVCPPMSHGSAGKTPNAYLTEVIDLGDIAGQALQRVMINDEYVTLGGVAHPDYGLPVLGNLAGYAWIKYYNGTQVGADPMLLAKYSAYPERPWSADMIGRGMCYAICTFRYNRDKFQGIPKLRFELGGIPLYDPRRDSTVGGTGLHRFGNKATWEATVNPMVAIYNIKRGIALDDGSTWGGKFAASDVSLASYFAAMNECDVMIDDGAFGTEPQFRAGLEVSVDEQPADIIAELMKVCAGQVAEIGGVWKVRAGSPGVPVMMMTDADMIINSPQDFKPFPSFANSYNGVHATYPEPASMWEQKELPPLYNAGFEALDQGQRLIADLGLPACPYGAQGRRLQKAYIAEERRFRRHGQTVPPDFAALEPLDAISWTSVVNGYTGKVFEIAEVTDDLMTALQRISLRERDAGDFVYGSLAAPAVVSGVTIIPSPQTVNAFIAIGISIFDSANAPRRPAILLSWDGVDQDGIAGMEYEVRLVGRFDLVSKGTTTDIVGQQMVVSDGILPNSSYEARLKMVSYRATAWSAWTVVNTPDTPPVTRPDIADGAVSDAFSSVNPNFYNISALSVGQILADISINSGGDFWQVSVSFIAKRQASALTIVLEEKQSFNALVGVFNVIKTWDIINDGALGGSQDYWPRDFAFGFAAATQRQYRLRVTAASGMSSFNCLYGIKLKAKQVTK